MPSASRAVWAPWDLPGVAASPTVGVVNIPIVVSTHHLGADGHQPSSVPGGSSACDTGTQQCCDYMGTSGQDSIIDHAIGLHGLTGVISAGSSVGLNCVASETDW